MTLWNCRSSWNLLQRSFLKNVSCLNRGISFSCPVWDNIGEDLSGLDQLKERDEKLKLASGMKKFKPLTPGLRWFRRPINSHLHKGKPFKKLTIPLRKKGGRNNTGRITVRHQGGGHKQRIRIVDFYRLDPGPQKVVRVEYDPGRSAHIALIQHGKTGVFSYILASEDLRAGSRVESFRNGITQELVESLGGVSDPGIIAAQTVRSGNCLPLKMIPTGTKIFAVGLHDGGKAQLCRAAGTGATLVSTGDEGYATIKLGSGEIRKVSVEACATIGTTSNPLWKHRMLGKAGRSRWLGIRPSVRGVAMNACDHPHGGGRGKSKGNKHPRSPWGQLKGAKTRKSKHNQNKLVVRPRPRGKEKRLA